MRKFIYAKMIRFDIVLHDKMDKFNTFTLRGKIYGWLHYRVHEIAFWASPDRAAFANPQHTVGE